MTRFTDIRSAEAFSEQLDKDERNKMHEATGQNETLGTALPKEMARVRDDILPIYVSLGVSGAIAAAMMRHDLDAASKAMIEGDTIAMIKVYQALKDYQL